MPNEKQGQRLPSTLRGEGEGEGEIVSECFVLWLFLVLMGLF